PAHPRVRVLRHPVNQGKGAALLTGLAAAAAVADYAVAVDADGQHDPREAGGSSAPSARPRARS
ncbi:MAG TPA: glycosyltransferase, partial [Polyangiaceae bacterium]|nr:glycosyltransferase [Polyangiaceae bacterium]